MPQPSQGPSNNYTMAFMAVLSFLCALILSLLASALQKPKEEAKELDRSSQMLLAARIYNGKGYFQIKEGSAYVPAQYTSNGTLVPSKEIVKATSKEILSVYRARMKPFLVDDSGNTTTFEEAKIDPAEYITKNKKRGYARLPWKLIYEILPNPDPNTLQASKSAEGYVIPVSGFGLWDYIYGYIAIAPDGEHVIGISWYEQKETPGLGANIAEADWQSQFPGKNIFQADSSGNIDFQKSSMGLIVVRGKVKDVLGTGPKANNAVDGMSGATLTGNGVMKAYKDTLGPYRPFFIRLHEAFLEEGKKS